MPFFFFQTLANIKKSYTIQMGTHAPKDEGWEKKAMCWILNL